MVYKGRNCVVHHKDGYQLLIKVAWLKQLSLVFGNILIYSWPTLVRVILLLKISFSF